MYNSTRETIYAGDFGYVVLIDMQASIVGASGIKFFVKKPDDSVVEITTNIVVSDVNYFKWVVPTGTTDLPGTYTVRPYFTLDGWTGSGKPVSFDVEAVDAVTT